MSVIALCFAAFAFANYAAQGQLVYGHVPALLAAMGLGNIFGEDSRLDSKNIPKEPPFSQVGAMRAVSGDCTATLVDRNKILTAGHCFSGSGDGFSAQGRPHLVRFWNAKTGEVVSAYVERVWRPKTFFSQKIGENETTGANGVDWAIATLGFVNDAKGEEHVGERLGWMDLEHPSAQADLRNQAKVSDKSYNVASFSPLPKGQEKNGGVPYEFRAVVTDGKATHCRFRSVHYDNNDPAKKSSSVSHDCDIAEGSGSPIFTRSASGKGIISALHVASAHPLLGTKERDHNAPVDFDVAKTGNFATLALGAYELLERLKEIEAKLARGEKLSDEEIELYGQGAFIPNLDDENLTDTLDGTVLEKSGYTRPTKP